MSGTRWEELGNSSEHLKMVLFKERLFLNHRAFQVRGMAYREKEREGMLRNAAPASYRQS